MLIPAGFSPGCLSATYSLFPEICPVTLPGGNRGGAPKPPLPKGGASAAPRRGDSEAGRSPHRSVLSESANCESLSHGCAVPAPFSKGAAACRRSQFRTVIFCESLLPLQCPVSLLRCSRCTAQSPPCQRGVVWRSQTGGIPRLAGLHIGLYFLKVPTVNPSVKNQRFLPAPFSKGAAACRRSQFRTVIFCESLLP